MNKKSKEIVKFDYPLLAIDIPKKAAQEQGGAHLYYPRASNTGTERCVRADVYHGLKIPRKPFPGRTMLIFSDSTFHEDLTNDWIRKLAYKLHSEQMGLDCLTLPFGKEIRRYCSICKKEYPGNIVHGHPDGLLQNITTLEDFLYEHKAISFRQFEKYELGEVPIDYVCQCVSYLCGCKKLLPNIDKAILLIKNKNTAQYMQFVIHYDFDKDIADVILAISNGKVKNEKVSTIKDVKKTIIDRYALINKHIEEKELPLRQYNIDQWRCTLCGWGEVCYEKYQEEFEKLTVKKDLDQDIQDLFTYYLETDMHHKEMGKEKKKLFDKIFALMKERELGQGRAGNYLVKRTLKESSSLDKKMLPVDLVKMATTITRKEDLSIRKLTKKQLTDEAKGLNKSLGGKESAPLKEERGAGKPPEFSKETKIDTE